MLKRLGKARADAREDVEEMQDKLRRSQDDMRSLQKQMAALREEHKAIAKALFCLFKATESLGTRSTLTKA